ncbi:MAG: LD-carboxypeptidase [Ignavibacteria bacterium]|jgi:muramoyltetrapeptide carboxypeptidase|nr:LD-carboxypeptidase [Ignavibacteria bacterium]MCU7502736.1 LD-carboxypeptidase [Ignavibacteria bacterium]MCU7517335.1 LD-carboxypeptidase [Ignavibacteria bacterium]
MHRRNFIKTVSAASAVTLLPHKLFAGDDPKNTIDSTSLIKPRRLKKGDTLGLITPASFISEDELKESVKNLESLGFKVVYTDNVTARYGYLGGKDEVRAKDVNLMFSRKDVDGIVCTRGGYGCARMFPYLDFEMIKNNPKVIVGYSDVTSLLYAITQKTNMVTFHGPVGTSTFNDFSLNYFKGTLMEPSDSLTLWNARDENPDDISRKVFPIRGGKAKGRLVGGNLSIVVSLIGTPYDINTDGKIVFLEEVSEEPYRVDRMLTQMIEAGKFDRAAGIALGVFEKCEPRHADSPSLSLQEVLMDRLFDLKIPVIYGLSFGHIVNKFTMPLGVMAELDVDNQNMKFLEQAVL